MNYVELLRKIGKAYSREDIEKQVIKGRINNTVGRTLCRYLDFFSQKSPVPFDMQLKWDISYYHHTNEYSGAGAERTFLLPEKLSLESFHITFYYDEIEIVNSKEDRHTIKDLYVTVIFKMLNDQWFYPSDIRGRRGKATFTEYKKGYRHSHLPSRPPSNDFMELTTFCLGDGELHNTMSLLIGEQDWEMLELMMHQIGTYVRWESIEGVPYISMSTLVDEDYNLSDLADKKAYEIAETALKGRNACYSLLRWTYNGKKKRYEIQGEECIENFLIDAMERNNIYPSHFYFKDAADNLFSEDTITAELLEVNLASLSTFHFQNREIKLSIEGKPLKAENRKLYPHKKLIQYAKQLLEYHANAYKIRESRIKEFH